MDQSKLAYWEAQFLAYLREIDVHSDDASHDISHFARVWRTCRYINEKEDNRGDLLVLLTASYFHDLIPLPKDHPDRDQASEFSALKTSALLEDYFEGFPKDKIPAVAHAIHAHSFSAGIEPESFEAKVLQDADRLDALGAIGIARTFYIAGKLRSSLFHPEDPLARERQPDDQRYALDHFEVKLRHLPDTMHTATGKAMAKERADYLDAFRARLVQELEGAAR